jgi:DNA topoisomerase IB
MCLGPEDRGYAGLWMRNSGNRVSIGGASLYPPLSLDLIATAMAMVKILTDKRGAACLTKRAAQSATLGSLNNAQCRRRANRSGDMGKHVLYETGIRRIGSKERGFSYRDPGTNEAVREERVLSRIENLKVPPAWEDARIARSPSAKVQAVGYDSTGRLQYRYHEKYRERKEHEKFDRILRFSAVLPEMRRITSNHLRHKHLDREKVLATMTRLMNAAHFRVGDERYARKNKTYGIATLRRKHLTIEGDTLTFEFTGKWGQQQRKVVTDPRLRAVVEECA